MAKRKPRKDKLIRHRVLPEAMGFLACLIPVAVAAAFPSKFHHELPLAILMGKLVWDRVADLVRGDS